MYGTPSLVAPRFGWMPQSAVVAAAAQMAFTEEASLVPLKQYCAAMPDPQESVTKPVTVGVLNLPCPSRKYEKRASFTDVAPMVHVCVTFTCCVRVAV